MAEIILDEELLEWALPVLQEFVIPSKIAVELISTGLVTQGMFNYELLNHT